MLVLYSTRALRMSEVGFGLLANAAAVGGIISTSCYGWLESHIPLATLMRTCLTLEVLMHLALAVNRSAGIAVAIMFGFGAYAFVWGTLSQSVRMRATPPELQGRVGAAYTVGLYGGLVVGQFLGGVIAERWGLTAPFWFAFVGLGDHPGSALAPARPGGARRPDDRRPPRPGERGRTSAAWPVCRKLHCENLTVQVIDSGSTVRHSSLRSRGGTGRTGTGRDPGATTS